MVDTLAMASMEQGCGRLRPCTRSGNEGASVAVDQQELTLFWAPRYEQAADTIVSCGVHRGVKPIGLTKIRSRRTQSSSNAPGLLKEIYHIVVVTHCFLLGGHRHLPSLQSIQNANSWWRCIATGAPRSPTWGTFAASVKRPSPKIRAVHSARMDGELPTRADGRKGASERERAEGVRARPNKRLVAWICVKAGGVNLAGGDKKACYRRGQLVFPQASVGTAVSARLSRIVYILAVLQPEGRGVDEHHESSHPLRDAGGVLREIAEIVCTTGRQRMQGAGHVDEEEGTRDGGAEDDKDESEAVRT
ncbi:hypothetical protein HD554DRAFT_2035629 [Boletus coccyginus]|nr:hypothetical protein HD554DRAFT_2035629 [Boletus coccyginus]